MGVFRTTTIQKGFKTAFPHQSTKATCDAHAKFFASAESTSPLVDLLAHALTHPGCTNTWLLLHGDTNTGADKDGDPGTSVYGVHSL
mmetsp:Transcript_42820/g.69598  ORF Transcript_42820/g.69598 Transcript_42820/m.69598 type:complete len:87 (-) Transcript_42820:19-279(-)